MHLKCTKIYTFRRKKTLKNFWGAAKENSEAD